MAIFLRGGGMMLGSVNEHWYTNSPKCLESSKCCMKSVDISGWSLYGYLPKVVYNITPHI